MRFCPCFGSDEVRAIADRDPLLLVSGMGGSIVNSKPKTFGFTTRVWVRLLLADMEFRKKIWSLYNPKTGPSSTSSLSTIFEFSVKSLLVSQIDANSQATVKRWTRSLSLWFLTMIMASMRSIFWIHRG